MKPPLPTLNPINQLTEAIRDRRPCRVVFRRHHEEDPERFIEGWPLELAPAPRGGVRVVVCASRTGSADAARWVVHIDRIALVETLPLDALGGS